MAIRKSPHPNTQQDTKPEQSDLDVDEQEFEADSEADQAIYQEAEGAETGMNRSSREIDARSERHRVEPETEAHEGRISTRTPKRGSQGITAHSAEEESERQEKVVKDRPNAKAGVNRSKKAS
jgi:hypothetical protein